MLILTFKKVYANLCLGVLELTLSGNSFREGLHSENFIFKIKATVTYQASAICQALC